MKQTTLLILFSFLCPLFLTAQQPLRCGTAEYMEHIKKNIPDYDELVKEQEERAKKYRESKDKAPIEVTIPIVIHILHNQADGSIEGNNISDEQIQSQIDRLNTDFGGLNEDLVDVPAEFQAITANGTGISFCLADIDPEGNFTTGINRIYTEKTEFNTSENDAKFTSDGGQDAWPRCSYINIWVAPRIVNNNGAELLGYTQLPSGAVGGFADTDGIVVTHRYFGDDIGTAVRGTGAELNNYYKGRTLVHEMGHYLGLLHIWGDDNGACTGDDGVADTPNQGDSSAGCPFGATSCSSTDIVVNFMDYSYDDCLLMFTQGQSARMEETLLTHPSRSCLMNASEASCITNCFADHGTVEVEDIRVCANGTSKPLTINSTNPNTTGFKTAFAITGLFEPNPIVSWSESNEISFQNFAPGEYGVHPINYESDANIIQGIDFGITTLADLQNYLVNNQICASVMTNDYPVFTVLEPLKMEYELICQLDAFGNNRGDALLDVEVTGGSGEYYYWDGPSGVADQDLIDHEESFTLRVIDSLDCGFIQKIEKVDCVPYDYSAIGYGYLEMQQTLVNDILYIHYHSPTDLPATLSIYNAAGQLMMQERQDTRTGVNRVDVDTKLYAPGIYIISLDNRNEHIQKKFGKFRF